MYCLGQRRCHILLCLPDNPRPNLLEKVMFDTGGEGPLEFLLTDSIHGIGVVGEGKRRGGHWVEFTLFLLPQPEQLSLYLFDIVDFEERLLQTKWI